MYKRAHVERRSAVFHLESIHPTFHVKGGGLAQRLYF